MNRAETSPIVRLDLERAHRFRVRFESGAPCLIVDEPPPLGTGSGPDPSSLLASAVGGCLASSFLFCVRKARIEPLGLEVEVRLEHERNAEGRMRIGRIRARLVPHVEERDRARLRACIDLYESFCTVTESVRQGIPVDVLLEPMEAGTPGWPSWSATRAALGSLS